MEYTPTGICSNLQIPYEVSAHGHVFRNMITDGAHIWEVLWIFLQKYGENGNVFRNVSTFLFDSLLLERTLFILSTKIYLQFGLCTKELPFFSARLLVKHTLIRCKQTKSPLALAILRQKFSFSNCTVLFHIY